MSPTNSSRQHRRTRPRQRMGKADEVALAASAAHAPVRSRTQTLRWDVEQSGPARRRPGGRAGKLAHAHSHVGRGAGAVRTPTPTWDGEPEWSPRRCLGGQYRQARTRPLSRGTRSRSGPARRCSGGQYRQARVRRLPRGTWSRSDLARTRRCSAGRWSRKEAVGCEASVPTAGLTRPGGTRGMPPCGPA
jgi:hypothetical protein